MYLDIGTAGVAFEFNKAEGVALLDGMAGVAIVNDNDFGFAQPDDLTISPAADATEQLRFYTSRPSGTAPSVSGTAQAGRTLTCSPGTYGGTGALAVSYQWLRGATLIAGADTSRLTLSSEDVGAAIACRVAATRVAGPVRAPAAAQTSAATAAVAGFETSPAGPQGAPGIKGDSGATGAIGPTAASGSRGPAGATGPRGKSAPLPKVTCTLRKRGGRVTGVRCTVKAGATTRRVVARVARRTVASAVVRRGVARLSLRAAYRNVTILALDRHGKVLSRTSARAR